MLQIIRGIILQTWSLLIEMAPYLLFGFFIAGILHVFMPKEKIYKHFSKASFASVVKASLFGVPLPLCSCGVIPVALHLNKQKASKSATISFLTSTPTTGIDSILATYSLLGPVFAIIRPISSFFVGILSGTLVNITQKKEVRTKPSKTVVCDICSIESPHSHGVKEKTKLIFKYGFLDLTEDIGKWLLLGVLVGGIIGYAVPSDVIFRYLGKPQFSYPLMLLLGIPMYVCATGSIPIAASLIAKGMSPGAGLVFLLTGPATNTATLSFVGGKLGRKVLIIYIFSIVFTAVLFGFILDYIWAVFGWNTVFVVGKVKVLPYWLKVCSGALLAVLVLRGMFFRKAGKKIKGMGRIFDVPDITCRRCVKTLEDAIGALDGVKEVRVNLRKKKVEVEGDTPESVIVSAIKKAGYEVKKQ